MPPPNTPTTPYGGPTHTPRTRSVDLTTTLLPILPPPNSPTSTFNSPGATRMRQYVSLGGQPFLIAPTYAEREEETPKLDHLTYVNTVDENLVCPICRVPFVDPVETECNHTFCTKCITEALKHSTLCPIDRHQLSKDANLKKCPRIILNQLDNLMVECPSGCKVTVSRGMLQNHIERYCNDTFVPCHDLDCEKLVKRSLSERGCLHGNVVCPDCFEDVMEMHFDDHRETLCTKRETSCTLCGLSILKHKKAKHDAEDCSQAIVHCQWMKFGCDHKTTRELMTIHQKELCTFRVIGPVANMMMTEIQELKSEVSRLSEKDKIQEARIHSLEAERKFPHFSHDDESGPDAEDDDRIAFMSSFALQSHSTNVYLLDLIADQETRVNELALAQAEIENHIKQMINTETSKLWIESQDIRNTQQHANMQLRWLIEWRKDELSALTRRKRGVGRTGPGDANNSNTATRAEGESGESGVGTRGDGSDRRGSSSDSTAPRRSSADSMSSVLRNRL